MLELQVQELTSKLEAANDSLDYANKQGCRCVIHTAEIVKLVRQETCTVLNSAKELLGKLEDIVSTPRETPVIQDEKIDQVTIRVRLAWPYTKLLLLSAVLINCQMSTKTANSLQVYFASTPRVDWALVSLLVAADVVSE
ncbi:hypothetical protein HPB50_011115 [Hyalomma asiaticum]|uniref:Uncharacterized protein n=1 Tax=Hyalomma asiaticum TaxID=266040 RepID=A0ACB7SFZ2_HYAAI|nr:hypothetical protein HPB50_011115 [Hyalomma asiaticum]